MSPAEFAERARESARTSAVAQGFQETVTDPESLRLVRVLLHGGAHASA
ncbi:UNVERIFIED_ORG: hypothetical protein M2328_003525 [Rhodococcus erythropolis]